MKFIKHHTNARNSLKLQKLRAELGQKGYGQYWSLLELLGEKFDGINTIIPVHFNEIGPAVDLKFSKSVMTFIQKLNDFELIQFQVEKEVYQIDAPILFELQDKHSKYNRKRVVQRSQSATLDKEVEVDKEVDKELTTPTPSGKFNPGSWLKTTPEKLTMASVERFTPDHFVDLWNECFGKTLSWCHGLGGGVHRDNFLAALEFLPTEKCWRELFQLCMSSPKCMGQNDIGWTISPTWIVNYDNALKVLNGDFDESKASKVLFAGLKSSEASA